MAAGAGYYDEADKTLKYLNAFKSLEPPTYDGNSDPSEAEEWLRGVTKCLNTIDAPQHLRVNFAAMMLTGEAYSWLEFAKKAEPHRTMKWEGFNTRFRNMYIPKLYRSKKAKEFASLTQEDMKVAQYAGKFVQLSRYATSLVRYECLKIQRFIDGLRPSIGSKMASSDYSFFEEAVDAALNFEFLDEDDQSTEEPDKEGK
ncbi:hypothetical protein TIFTF001_028753 [Ficus carica]|uniref:Retrotransposon gag domain-containing protein n=1 Tax=Ficus carica TaxID=3494 RepID=A0AA88J2D8_FICCA|nr:hypothetical protein TIFTF001_028753 [Ficus carica]